MIFVIQYALICDSMMLTLHLCLVASVSVLVLILRVAGLLTTLTFVLKISCGYAKNAVVIN